MSLSSVHEVVLTKPIGSTIRILRRRKGVTLDQLARRAGVSEKTLRLLEREQTDTPHPETISAIAGALGVSPESLFEPLVTSEALPPNEAPSFAHLSPGEPLAFVVVRDEQRRLLSRYRIVNPQTTIGRGVDNIINLSDAVVSEYHAILNLIGSQVQIRDMGSTNGTYINGSRVNGRADVQWGDDITIGPYHIEFVSPASDPDGFPIHATDLMTPSQKS